MIKRATLQEINLLAGLAVLLWDSHSIQDLEEEFTEIILNGDSQFFLKYDQDTAVGFAQCQLRTDYVEGTMSSPVGYLEGIFVKEEYRRRGYARELVAECEKWAAEKGCTEFASDCELDNVDSLRFHMAVGFAEVNRIICFARKL